MRAARPLYFTVPLIAGVAALAACSSDSTDVPVEQPAAATEVTAAEQPAPAPAVTVVELPDVITAARGGFVPEGMDYDQANGRFLTGSFADGSIYEIGVDGSVTPVITDPELVSSVGIEVDESRNRILVANSNASVFGMPLGDPDGPPRAKLGVYDLSTGERLAMVDLAAQLDAGDGAVFFANDVAAADDGTAFVTDTVQNVVYRVDADYTASVHYTFEPAEGQALNGIVYHPDGYLIIGDVGTGRLYRLATTAGAAADVIAVPEALVGADGLVWRADGALAIVQNSPSDGRVVALTSDDGWATARILEVATHEGQSTALAVVGGDIYMVQPHFADANPPTIERAAF